MYNLNSYVYFLKGELHMEKEELNKLRAEAMENYKLMRECDRTLRKIKKIEDAENRKKEE